MANFEEYERAKLTWIDSHPEATQAEYEAAMRRIARECGL